MRLRRDRARALGHHSIGVKSKPSVEAALTWPQVLAFRLARHYLARRAPKRDLAKVVGAIGGAQAQVMSAAEMQIAARVECSAADVRRALWEQRTLVKTWLMRGTLHLVPASDLPLYAAAMRTRWMRPRPSVLKWLGMTAAELDAFTEAIGGALTDTPMTREQVIAVVGAGRPARVREWLRSGWGGLLKPAARRGLLCFGPSRGASVTFVRPAMWLGSWRELDPDASLVEVARRYLRAYGPASRSDFARWWGPSWAGVAQAAWAGLAKEVVPVSIEGTRADVLARDLEALAKTTPRASVALLPPFDPFLMGHASRDHLFERVHAPKVSRTAGWISAVVLVDGRVAGTWTHAIARRTLRVTVAPFAPHSSKVRREVAQRAESLAAATGVASVDIVWAHGTRAPTSRAG
jgi:hypothetical protein